MNKAAFETLKTKIVVAERLVRLYQDEYKAETGGRFVASGPFKKIDLISALSEVKKDFWRII